jgi:hypothetical protein
LAKGPEVAAVPGIFEFGYRRDPSRRRNVDDSAQCVAAIERAVGATQYFQIADTSIGKLGEVKGSADLVHGDSVDQNLIEIGFATPDEQGGNAAALACLHYLRSGYQPQVLENIKLIQRLYLVAINHGYRSANLRFRDCCTGC